jgi:hypothetical protein
VLVSRNAGDVLPLARPGAGPGALLLSPERYPPTPLALERLVRDLDAAARAASTGSGSRRRASTGSTSRRGAHSGTEGSTRV